MMSSSGTTLLVFLGTFALLMTSAVVWGKEDEVDVPSKWSPVYGMAGMMPSSEDERGPLMDIMVPAQIVNKRDARRVRLCGDQLASAMKLACTGFRGKRSLDTRFHPLLASIMDTDEIPRGDGVTVTRTKTLTPFQVREQLRFLFLGLTPPPLPKPYVIPQHLDRSFERRRRAGIIQTCCVNACTLAHLEAYC